MKAYEEEQSLLLATHYVKFMYLKKIILVAILGQVMAGRPRCFVAGVGDGMPGSLVSGVGYNMESIYET